MALHGAVGVPQLANRFAAMGWGEFEVRPVAAPFGLRMLAWTTCGWFKRGRMELWQANGNGQRVLRIEGLPILPISHSLNSHALGNP